MVDASPQPVAPTPSKAPSLIAIGCGGLLIVMAIGLLVIVIAVRSLLGDIGLGGGEHHWWPWWDHHDRPEPWDPHDHHHDHDDHHHRRRSERVEDFLDNYANNVGAVYIEADHKKHNGERPTKEWFDRLFAKAHERAAASIKKEIEDTGEGPNYLELGHEFQGKEE
jgi:hypothetical protein